LTDYVQETVTSEQRLALHWSNCMVRVGNAMCWLRWNQASSGL